LEIKMVGRPVFTQLLPDSRRHDAGELSFSLAQFADEASLEVSKQGCLPSWQWSALAVGFRLDGGTTLSQMSPDRMGAYRQSSDTAALHSNQG